MNLELDNCLCSWSTSESSKSVFNSEKFVYEVTLGTGFYYHVRNCFNDVQQTSNDNLEMKTLKRNFSFFALLKRIMGFLLSIRVMKENILFKVQSYFKT